MAASMVASLGTQPQSPAVSSLSRAQRKLREADRRTGKLEPPWGQAAVTGDERDGKGGSRDHTRDERRCQAPVTVQSSTWPRARPLSALAMSPCSLIMSPHYLVAKQTWQLLKEKCRSLGRGSHLIRHEKV